MCGGELCRVRPVSTMPVTRNMVLSKPGGLVVHGNHVLPILVQTTSPRGYGNRYRPDRLMDGICRHPVDAFASVCLQCVFRHGHGTFFRRPHTVFGANRRDTADQPVNHSVCAVCCLWCFGTLGHHKNNQLHSSCPYRCYDAACRVWNTGVGITRGHQLFTH